MSESRNIEELAKDVINNIVKAYEELRRVLKIDLPKELVNEALRETEHIVIHELCHAAIRKVYPEIGKVYDVNEAKATCVDELVGRLLETYVSRRVGAFVHSFEEHITELRLYAPLSNLNITPELLKGLYEEMVKAIEGGKLREFIKKVERDICRIG
ncbi:MAG TPA: hypothetical protein ENF75_01050 [Acidilobales archaeon]|nr:hypothetical protein [Acidilobales archaeon]